MIWLTLVAILGLLLALEMLMSKLCRYCKRFLDKQGRNGICSRCWRGC